MISAISRNVLQIFPVSSLVKYKKRLNFYFTYFTIFWYSGVTGFSSILNLLTNSFKGIPKIYISLFVLYIALSVSEFQFFMRLKFKKKMHSLKIIA